MAKTIEIRGMMASRIPEILGRVVPEAENLPANPGSVMDGFVDDKGGRRSSFRSAPTPLSVRLRQVCEPI